MIGHFGFGSSYSGALDYCMQDKDLAEEQKQKQDRTEDDRRQTKNRAEVLYYHQCYGDIAQLTQQFKEARKQNLNVLKPVFHLSLSLPSQDKIPKSRFVDIAKDCAKTLGFERHQYVVVLHRDTPYPHIHLVVNRIGPEKHFRNDKRVFKRVNDFCRETELKYQLTPEKSMRRYRSPEDRLKPDENPRVLRLKEEVTQTLKQTHDLASFKEQMQDRGFKVYKTERGISFKDADGVYLTGSRAGYPWKKVEAELAQNLAQRQAQEQRLELERSRHPEIKQKPVHMEDDEPQQIQRRGLRMHM